jgi:hypothetical protein
MYPSCGLLFCRLIFLLFLLVVVVVGVVVVVVVFGKIIFILNFSGPCI